MSRRSFLTIPAVGVALGLAGCNHEPTAPNAPPERIPLAAQPAAAPAAAPARSYTPYEPEDDGDNQGGGWGG